MRAVTVLIALLLLMPLGFAAWQALAGVAIMTSLAILLLIFMLGMAFGARDLKMMAREEFFQLIALAGLVVLLASGDSFLNWLSTNEAFIPDPGEYGTMQEAAVGSLQESRNQLSTYFGNIAGLDNRVAQEAAKGARCSIMGVGYSVSGCGGFSMLNPPLGTAGGIVGFAIGELAALEKLLLVATTYGLQLLLPAGIVLRTLKVTRGAGGLLIALGVSMFIVIPMGIIFVDMMADNFVSYNGEIDWVPADIDDPYHPESSISISDVECRPEQSGTLGNPNEEKATNVYDNMRAALKEYLYWVLIKATLGPAVAILMFISSLKFMTSLAGAEVDMSGLARLV
ncbi:TPA: hypothetical protein EYP38_04465 [Candidatus Micrarchaeota archaeon]|nr:hypothetical protein [Candidatus Micrarchaeota archaeon]